MFRRFREGAFLEIPRISYLFGVAGLHSTGCKVHTGILYVFSLMAFAEFFYHITHFLL